MFVSVHPGGEYIKIGFNSAGKSCLNLFAIAGSIGWQRLIGTATPSTDLALSGNPFTISGVPLATNAAVVGLGLGVQISRAASVSLSYGGQHGDGATNSAISGNLALLF